LKIQAYVAYSCFRQAGYDVEFKTWNNFSRLITHKDPASAAKQLKEEGFDCVLGGIDLSLR
jgi:hypothetical protein